MSVYNAKYLGHRSIEVEGELLLFPDKVVFKPKKEYAEKMKKAVFRPCHAHGFTDCPYCGKAKNELRPEYTRQTEILVDNIKDARFAKEEDITALRVWLVGPVLGTLWKEQHRILIVDFEDEFGIVQHLVFEGEDLEEALEELYEIRKTRKLDGKSASGDLG